MPVDLPNVNPRQVDPALLTFDEYWEMVDPKKKTHPNSAYDVSVADLNQYDYQRKENFPRLLRRIRRHGLDFELRLGTEKIEKTDPDRNIIRIDGEIQYYTDEECQRMGYWLLGLFEGDTMVGAVQDEWGCVLVWVAREYRRFGFGSILLKMAYSIQPDKSSGGFTSKGFATFRRVYREFVGDALKSGLYRKLIQQGDITLERVKAIVASASTIPRSTQSAEMNLSSENASDWLLYVGEHGDFIIYNRNLRGVLEEGERADYFAERMIKGIAYVPIHEGHSETWAMLRVFGGDSPKIRKFLINCAIEYCLRENATLYLEAGEPTDLDSSMGAADPESLAVRGFRSHKVIPTGKRMPYDQLAMQERAWRRSFDRYDEFRMQMMEMAYSKYRRI